MASGSTGTIPATGTFNPHYRETPPACILTWMFMMKRKGAPPPDVKPCTRSRQLPLQCKHQQHQQPQHANGTPVSTNTKLRKLIQGHSYCCWTPCKHSIIIGGTCKDSPTSPQHSIPACRGVWARNMARMVTLRENGLCYDSEESMGYTAII